MKTNWILVPIDFSKESRLALEAADRQARAWDSGLILLHVSEGPVADRESLEEWTRWLKLNTPDSAIAFVAAKGDPVSRLIQAVAEYRVRAVFMGRGGNAERPGPVALTISGVFPELVTLVSEAGVHAVAA